MYRTNAKPKSPERRQNRYPLRGRWRLFRLRIHLTVTSRRVSGHYWMSPWPHVWTGGPKARRERAGEGKGPLGLD